MADLSYSGLSVASYATLEGVTDRQDVSHDFISIAHLSKTGMLKPGYDFKVYRFSGPLVMYMITHCLPAHS